MTLRHTLTEDPGCYATEEDRDETEATMNTYRVPVFLEIAADDATQAHATALTWIDANEHASESFTEEDGELQSVLIGNLNDVEPITA